MRKLNEKTLNGIFSEVVNTPEIQDELGDMVSRDEVAEGDIVVYMGDTEEWHGLYILDSISPNGSYVECRKIDETEIDTPESLRFLPNQWVFLRKDVLRVDIEKYIQVLDKLVQGVHNGVQS